MTHTLPHPALADAEDFSPLSRVWMYVADRDLSPAETAAVQSSLALFCTQWTAHNQALKARGEVFQNRLLLLMVDETAAGASGCSIDKSVHFLEALGRELGVDWFNRMQFAWMDAQNAVRFGSREAFEQHVKNGAIQPDTYLLDTLANTREALQSKFWVPFQVSWQKKLA